MAPLGPACSPLSVVMASVTMAPYFRKDGFILFPLGTAGVELVISLGLWDTGKMSSPSEYASLCPFS